MNDLKVFENIEFGELEILTVDGKEYFPAVDCAKILGYTNPRDAIARHCKLEGVVKHDGCSNRINQYGATSELKFKKTYINEGNLYRLIIKSKLPSAEKFEKWVFEEVLPTIRKTGSYISVQAFDDLEKRVKKIEAKALMPIKSSQYSIGVNTSEIAYSLGIPPKRLFDFLIVTGIVYRKWDKYELHNDYVGFGYIQNVRKSQETCNCKRIKYWTLQGVRFVTDLYNNIATSERVTR